MTDRTGEAIVVTSGKGGVGKTTMSAHLGANLAGLGNRTVVIDTDIGLRNLDLVLGMGNQVVYHLLDVVEETCSLTHALIAHKTIENLYLLPSAQTRRKEELHPGQMKRLTEEAKRQFDYVIIDCPAGVEQGFYNAIAGADRAVIVTTPDVTAVRDADRIFRILEEQGIYRCGLVINRVHPSLVQKKLMMSREEIADLIPIPVYGVIPEDETVLIAAGQGKPLQNDDSAAGTAFMNTSRRILGEELPFLSSDPENAGRKKKRFSFFVGRGRGK